MGDRDRGYRKLFSHPDMVRDLLKGFVHEEWVAELDFSTLERQNGSYISDDLREREDDSVWRVRFRDRWLYVYVLLEFQSSVDRFMAVRMMTYVGLLYQDLVQRRELADGALLPPVVPIVLHAGDDRWSAATNVAEIVCEMPFGLNRWRPRVSYLLLEERILATSLDPSLRNLAGALFRLEHDRRPHAILEVINALVAWLSDPARADLRRAFEVMIERVLRPETTAEITAPTLEEAREMLETNFQRWEREWHERSEAHGRAEGEAIGRRFILRQLERRFGPLDASVGARVEAATTEQLLSYADRVLDAHDIESVFTE
jgi:predicted transposase YdaD